MSKQRVKVSVIWDSVIIGTAIVDHLNIENSGTTVVRLTDLHPRFTEPSLWQVHLTRVAARKTGEHDC